SPGTRQQGGRGGRRASGGRPLNWVSGGSGTGRYSLRVGLTRKGQPETLRLRRRFRDAISLSARHGPVLRAASPCPDTVAPKGPMHSTAQFQSARLGVCASPCFPLV